MSGKVNEESGIPVGNVYDKYGTRNPIARLLVGRFLDDVLELVGQTKARDVHEIGCGEGYLTRLIARSGPIRVRGSDFSAKVIKIAQSSNEDTSVTFQRADIYSLGPGDSAELLVCCEVLEHLADPEGALRVLSALEPRYVIFSVPREPLWRVLNMVRGKYLRQLGNTPGHVQHWSRRRFLDLLSRHFEIETTRSPFPWTIALCRPRSSRPD